MLKRVMGYLLRRDDDDAPASSRQLQEEGYTHLEGVFSAAEIQALTKEIDAVYETYPRDGRAEGRWAEEDP